MRAEYLIVALAFWPCLHGSECGGSHDTGWGRRDGERGEHGEHEGAEMGKEGSQKECLNG